MVQPTISRRAWLLIGAVAAGLWLSGCSPQSSTTDAPAQSGTPIQGGTLVYLEQQAHTSLYPPAGGFYPNGGILNRITD